MPMCFFFILWDLKKEHKLANTQSRERYGYLYIKYTGDRWYWEFIILLRKSGLVLTLILLASDDVKFEQILLALFVVTVALSLQIGASPFAEARLNGLEQVSLFFTTIILGFGVFFLTGKVPFGSANSVGVAILMCIIVGIVSIILGRESVLELIAAIPILKKLFNIHWPFRIEYINETSRIVWIGRDDDIWFLFDRQLQYYLTMISLKERKEASDEEKVLERSAVELSLEEQSGKDSFNLAIFIYCN